MNRYATIVADPPWDQMGGPLTGPAGFGGAKGKSKKLPYETMSVEEIMRLRVLDVAAPDAHLYLWTTNAYLEEAFRVVRAWSFKFSTFITWSKQPMGGGLGGDAFGISSEYILFCRRGKPKARRRMDRTVFDWKREYDLRGKPDHSRKPAAFIDMVEQISEPPYLEMFARQNRLGWDSWGDGCLSVELPYLTAHTKAVA